MPQCTEKTGGKNTAIIDTCSVLQYPILHLFLIFRSYQLEDCAKAFILVVLSHGLHLH